MTRLARRFLFLRAAITATVAMGTVGFTAIDLYPPFDAFYMTLTTMTTVGYGEIHPLSRPGLIFNSFLVIFGFGILSIGIGAITQTVIELEFGEAIERRRNKRKIHHLHDHFIV